jgi:hypothetical protein
MAQWCALSISHQTQAHFPVGAAQSGLFLRQWPVECVYTQVHTHMHSLSCSARAWCPHCYPKLSVHLLGPTQQSSTREELCDRVGQKPCHEAQSKSWAHSRDISQC